MDPPPQPSPTRGRENERHVACKRADLTTTEQPNRVIGVRTPARTSNAHGPRHAWAGRPKSYFEMRSFDSLVLIVENVDSTCVADVR